MFGEMYILGGIFVCTFLLLLNLKKRKRKKVVQFEANIAANRNSAHMVPPPLPVRTAPSLPPRNPNLRLLDYPKCPLDRSRNEPGKPQVIFWNNAKKCYVCHHGHEFTGRE